MSGCAAPRCLASGIGFTEGPLWTHDGRLLVTSVSRGLIYEVDVRAGGATAVCNPGGRPTGLAEDDRGEIWIAQMNPDRPGIQKIARDVAIDVVGKDTDSPTDCTVGPDGKLWFTDPRGNAMGDDRQPGHVRTLDRTTLVVATVAGGTYFPNGIAFDRTGRWLYVAETATGRVLRGETASLRLVPWFDLPRGRPDGLAVDRDGRVYIAATAAAAVLVASAAGELIEEIALGPGALPTNVCFGGPDLGTLFVTVPSGGRVLAVERR